MRTTKLRGRCHSVLEARQSEMNSDQKSASRPQPTTHGLKWLMLEQGIGVRSAQSRVVATQRLSHWYLERIRIRLLQR